MSHRALHPETLAIHAGWRDDIRADLEGALRVAVGG